MKKRRRQTTNWLQGWVNQISACYARHEKMSPLGYRFLRPNRFCPVWIVQVFPRANQIYGGSEDGREYVPGFSVCLKQLCELFDEPPHLDWCRPRTTAKCRRSPALTLFGNVRRRQVHLQLLDAPPPGSAPGEMIELVSRSSAKRGEK